MTDSDTTRTGSSLLERLQRLFRGQKKPQIYLRHGQEPQTSSKLTCERIAWSGTQPSPGTRRPRF